MTEITFWRLIEAALAESKGNCERQAVLLARKLQTLSPEEIIAFYRLFIEKDGRAYRRDLKTAAWLINSSGSDDGFTDFRAWLISRGEAVYHAALENPDSLAEVALEPEEEAECEDFGYAALEAYENKTGEEMPKCPRSPVAPLEASMADEEIKARFPRMCARFWEDYPD